MKTNRTSIFTIIFMLIWTIVALGITGFAFSKVPFPMNLFVLIFPIFGIMMLIITTVNFVKQKKNTMSDTEKASFDEFNHLNYTVISDAPSAQDQDTPFTSNSTFIPKKSKNGNIFSGTFLMFFGTIWTSIVGFGINMIMKTELVPKLVIIFLSFFVLIGVIIFILGIYILISGIIKSKKDPKTAPTSNQADPISPSTAKIYCNYCGKEMTANEKFCTNCGAKKLDN